MQLLNVQPLYERNQDKGPRKPPKKRPVRKITVGNNSLTVNEWAKKRGEHPASIYKRMAKGMTPEQAVTVTTMSTRSNLRAGREKALRTMRGAG